MSDRLRLQELLKSESLLFGDFTLVSGKKSKFYFDSKRTTLLPEGSWLTAREILRVLRERNIRADAIGGMTLGADPIICPVVAFSHREKKPLRGFIVRKEGQKEHGTESRIEANLKPQSDVVVVDDVVTTGGSTLSAIEAVEQAGHRVVAVLCLVDREQGGAEALSRWPFYSLYTRSEIFEDAPAKS